MYSCSSDKISIAISIIGLIISVISIFITRRIYIEQLKSEIKTIYNDIINSELLNLEKARQIYIELINSNNCEYYNNILLRIIRLLNDIDSVITKQRSIIKRAHPVVNLLLCKTYSIDELLTKSIIEHCNSHTGCKLIGGIRTSKSVDKYFIINIYYHLFGYSGYTGYIPYIRVLTHIIERNMCIIDDKYKWHLYKFMSDYITRYSYYLSMTKGLKIDGFSNYTINKIDKYILKGNKNHNKAHAYSIHKSNKHADKHIKKKWHLLHNIVFISYVNIHDFILATTWDIIKYIDDKRYKKKTKHK